MNSPLRVSSIKTVLIVDDDESSRLLLRFLESKGYGILEADSGNRAIEILQTKSVDLIISDLEMPNGNGFELLQKLHDRFPNPPPLIFISSREDLSETQLIGLGALRFFRKPFDREALLRAIEGVFVKIAA